MDFQVINRKNEQTYAKKHAFITLTPEGRIRFNQDAVSEMGLSDQQYVEFLFFGKKFFIVKSQSAEGYHFSKHQDGGGGFISARVPAYRILRSFNLSDAKCHQFYIIHTEHEFKKYPVFEIIRKPEKIN